MATVHVPMPSMCQSCKKRSNNCQYAFSKMPVRLTFRAPQYNTMIYHVACAEYKAGK